MESVNNKTLFIIITIVEAFIHSFKMTHITVYINYKGKNEKVSPRRYLTHY